MNSRSLAQALGLVLTGVFTLAGAAHAADTPTAAPQTVMVQGVQVAIDPATGRLREPTAAERAKLSKAFQQNGAMRKSSALAQPRTAADAKSTFRKVSLGNGVRATAVRVPTELMSNVVATRQPDGSINVHHDDHGVQAAPKAPEVTR